MSLIEIIKNIYSDKPLSIICIGTSGSNRDYYINFIPILTNIQTTYQTSSKIVFNKNENTIVLFESMDNANSVLKKYGKKIYKSFVVSEGPVVLRNITELDIPTDTTEEEEPSFNREEEPKVFREVDLFEVDRFMKLILSN